MAEWKKDPIDTLFDLVIEEQGMIMAFGTAIDEKDIVLALKQSWVSICTDYFGVSPEGALGQETPILAPGEPFQRSCGSTCGSSM